MHLPTPHCCRTPTCLFNSRQTRSSSTRLVCSAGSTFPSSPNMGAKYTKGAPHCRARRVCASCSCRVLPPALQERHTHGGVIDDLQVKNTPNCVMWHSIGERNTCTDRTRDILCEYAKGAPDTSGTKSAYYFDVDKKRKKNEQRVRVT